jgi:hypothetical protein
MYSMLLKLLLRAKKRQRLVKEESSGVVVIARAFTSWPGVAGGDLMG